MIDSAVSSTHIENRARMTFDQRRSWLRVGGNASSLASVAKSGAKARMP